MGENLEANVQDNGRIVYFEPNDLQIYDINGNGLSYDDLTDNTVFGNEKLSMSVDLQVIVPDRLQSSTDGQKVYQYNVANGGDKKSNWISLMNGTPITLENPVFNEYGVGSTLNEMTTEYTVASYHEVKKNGTGGYETLGIKSINISFEPNYYPIVNIKFVDIRCFSLMMPCDDVYIETVKNKGLSGDGFGSFYKSLFNMPYPRFLLTVRGYYGKPVTFELTLSKFSAGFDDSTGDMNIDVQFIGCVYGFYSDLPFNILLVAPYLDYMNNTNLSVLKKNERWKNENFTYAGDNGKSSGKHILTYIEYLKVFSEMPEKLKETQNEDVQKYTKKIGALDTVANEALKLIDETRYLVDNITRSNNVHRIGTHNDVIVFYFLTKPTTLEKAELNADIVSGYNRKMDNFVVLLKKVLKDFVVSGETGTVDINAVNGVKFQDTAEFKVFANVSTLEEFERRYSYDDVFTKERVGEILSVMSCYENIRTNRKYFTIDTKNIVKTLSVVYEWCRTESDKADRERAELIDGDMIRVFGFKPTIRNMFRQLFAHIDCFMESFYQLLSDINKDIEGGKRKAGELFRSTYSDIKDDASYDKDVSPFPAVYKLEDNINTLVYPGEDAHLHNIREVAFVEDIIDTLFKTNNNINGFSVVSDKLPNSKLFDLLSDIEGDETPSVETKTVTKKNDIKPEMFPYNPTIPCDYMNERSPYADCKNISDVSVLAGLRLGEIFRYGSEKANIEGLLRTEAHTAAFYTKDRSEVKDLFDKGNEYKYDKKRKSLANEHSKNAIETITGKNSRFSPFYSSQLGSLLKKNENGGIIYDYGPLSARSVSVKCFYNIEQAVVADILKPYEIFKPKRFLDRLNKGYLFFYDKETACEYNTDSTLTMFPVAELVGRYYDNEGNVLDMYRGKRVESVVGNIDSVLMDGMRSCYESLSSDSSSEDTVYASYYVPPVASKLKYRGDGKRMFYKKLSKSYIPDRAYGEITTDSDFKRFYGGDIPGYGVFSILELYRIIADVNDTEAAKRYPVIMTAIDKFEKSADSDVYMSSFYGDVNYHSSMNIDKLGEMLEECATKENKKRVEFLMTRVHIYSMYTMKTGTQRTRIDRDYLRYFIERYLDKLSETYKIKSLK